MIGDRGLPVVGEEYISKERRSAGKAATVLEPAPTRYGFVRLYWHASGRRSWMRTSYFWDRFEQPEEP